MGAEPLTLAICSYCLLVDVVALGTLLMVYRTFTGSRVSTAWLTLSGRVSLLVAYVLFNLATCYLAQVYLAAFNHIYVVGYGLLALAFIKHSAEL
ncbi:MAG: hypothetical protein DRJ69_02530 [Thermoprotei archaeon]|nr:MAG: hypothetical protein DRJ69_02530 [Thermoprotei archaeon]